MGESETQREREREREHKVATPLSPPMTMLGYEARERKKMELCESKIMFVPSRGARSAERREFWPPRQARPHANDTSNVTPLSTPRPKRGWTNRPLPSPPPPRRRALTLSLSLRPSPKRRWRRAQARTTTTSRWSPWTARAWRGSGLLSSASWSKSAEKGPP